MRNKNQEKLTLSCKKNKFLKNKKAIELTLRTVVVMIITVIVLAFLIPSNLNLSNLTGSGLDSIQENQCKSNPDAYFLNSPYNCDINDNCNSEEQNEWREQVLLWEKKLEGKNCPLLEEKNEEDKCGCLQTKIWEILNEESVEEKELASKSIIEIKEEGIKFQNNSEINFEDIKIDIRDFNYNIENNLEKMPNEVKLTYDRLKEIKIGGIFGIGGESAYEFMIKESIQKGLNPLLPLVVITQESRGISNAVSHTGCVGLMQFCYSTAKGYPQIFDIEKLIPSCHKKNRCDEDDRMNPEKSIRAGVTKLHNDARNLNNNLILTLTSYNAGFSIAKKCNIDEDLDSPDTLRTCVLGATHSYYKTEAKTNEVKGYIDKITGNFVTMYS